MKYLDIESLSELQRTLNDVELADYRLRCQLEAYSCEQEFPAGYDKKLSKSLEQKLVEQLEVSPKALEDSPVGSLEAQSARKTLINLICTLNAAHQDYDFSVEISLYASNEAQKRFSCLELSRLKRINDIYSLQQHVDSLFESLYQILGAEFRQRLWENIRDVIRPEECEIYSYIPDFESDPFSDNGALWSFCYFFYHKTMKKILLFSCTLSTCFSKDDESDSGNMDEEQELYTESANMETPLAMFETVI
eukprot:jgi/Galph1/648/GphlegSOOS_G5392.1